MNLDPFAHVQDPMDYILGGTGTGTALANRYHRRIREYESPEHADFRKTVLRHFKCPFEEKEACLFSANPDQCLFAHVNGSSTGSGAVQRDFKKVPTYVCIYNLVNSCSFETAGPTVQNLISNLPNSNHNQNSSNFQPKPCSSGLHLSVEQMANLDSYEQANCETIRRFFGPDGERKCGVCLETVLSKRLPCHQGFAILENCTHCFCAQCIITARIAIGGTGELSCPICRTTSAKVAFKRHFVDNPEYKRKLFKKCSRPRQIC